MSQSRDDDEPPKKKKKKPLSAKQTYNTVADTVTGANVRWKDNLFQAIGMVFFVLAGGVIGVLVTSEWIVGILLGVLAGLVLGFLVTGGILMIYRTVQHARGEHD